MLGRPSQRRDLDDAVVVCGGGAAGMAAALSAARGGAGVLLVEAGPRLGGTVAGALIHTLAGFYDSSGEPISGGLPLELIERLAAADPLARRRKMGRLWVFQVCPNAYQAAASNWIRRTPSIAVSCGSRVTSALRRRGRIAALQVSTPEGSLRVVPRAVIDATGTAEIVRLIDESLIIDDDRRAAGGWIFRLRGIPAGALAIPKVLAVARTLRAAAAGGQLPPECSNSWVDTGVYDDEAFVKLFVPLADDWRGRESRGEISARSQATQQAVIALLRTLPEFAHAELTQTGALGVRDGGRIRGRYTLTADDVRAGRRFADAAGRCAWPIEYWDPECGVQLEHLPDGVHYEIPMASLELPGIENVWAAGKCLSADRYAHASARVVGACWAMGEAVGAAAAEARPVCWSEEPAAARVMTPSELRKEPHRVRQHG